MDRRGYFIKVEDLITDALQLVEDELPRIENLMCIIWNIELCRRRGSR